MQITSESEKKPLICRKQKVKENALRLRKLFAEAHQAKASAKWHKIATKQHKMVGFNRKKMACA